MDSERSLSLPVRIGAVLIAALLVIPLLFGVVLATSGSARNGRSSAPWPSSCSSEAIIGVLAWFKRRAADQRQHDRQWGPRPRPPG